MTKGSNIEAIEKATGRSWEKWLEFFESIGAKDLSHTEIAKKVNETGTPGWWSQSVTVAYEQHIGRRKPGQRPDGKFDVSASRTIEGTMDETLDKWLELVEDIKEFNGVRLEGEPGISKTEKWRNWRCALSDGSRVVVGIYQKAPNKAGLGLAHEKLASAQLAEQQRSYWKSFLQKL